MKRRREKKRERDEGGVRERRQRGNKIWSKVKYMGRRGGEK